VGGVDDLVNAGQAAFIQRGIEGFPINRRGVIVIPKGQRLMDLLGARYIIARRSVLTSADGPPFPLLMKDGNVRLYRNDSALPRAFAATSVLETTPAAATARSYDPTFDPRMAVILEQPAPSALRGNQPAPIVPIPVVSYRLNEVVLAPDLPTSAIVVLTDSYDPGWSVQIDGQPAPLLRADGILRATLVPAGKHLVVFSYRPPLLLTSALVSLVALVVWAGLILHRPVR
jgi:hypothetical protein